MSNLTKVILFIFSSLFLSIGMYLLFSSIGVEDFFLQKIRDLLTRVFNSENQVALFQASMDYPQWDTKLILYRTDIQPNGEFQYYSLKYLSYIPIITFVSLGISYLLVTGVNRKKTLGFALGILMMIFFSCLTSGVIIRHLIFRIKKIAAVDYSEFAFNLNDKIFNIFIEDGFEWLPVFPFIFLMLTMVRFKDFGINLFARDKSNKISEQPQKKKTRSQRIEEKRERKKKTKQ